MTTEIIKSLDELMLRLERNHKSTLRLQGIANSYRYEPKNYECFLIIRRLRTNLNQLIQDQITLIDQFKEQSIGVKESHTLIDAMLLRYKQLDSEIAGYLLEAQRH